MNKKVSVFVLLILLVLPFALAQVEITKSSPNYVKSEEELNITITINSDNFVKSLDLHEFVPDGWVVLGWDLTGYDKVNTFYETRDMQYSGKDRTLNHWRFDKSFRGEITLEYRIMAEEPGAYDSLTVWTYPEGFNSFTTQLNVLPVTADVADFPTEEPIIKIPGVTIDLTLLAIIIIIASFLIAAIWVSYIARKRILEIKSRKRPLPTRDPADVSTEDLRAFIKLGLRRGYTLREMVNALRGGNINTTDFNRVAKEETIRNMNIAAKAKQKEIPTSYSRRLKRILIKLKRGKA